MIAEPASASGEDRQREAGSDQNRTTRRVDSRDQYAIGLYGSQQHRIVQLGRRNSS